MKDYKWIVHPYSYKERGHREISVIHETEFHGLKSYGWFGERKIFIATDSQYGNLNDDVARFAIKLAEEMAETLNITKPVPREEVLRLVKKDIDERDQLNKMMKKHNEKHGFLDIKPEDLRS